MQQTFILRAGILRWIAVCLCITVVVACNKRQAHITRGFYYWKTSYHLSAYEYARLDAVKSKVLYVRCFDIEQGPEGQPKPVAIVRHLASDSIPKVPVVFITQQVLKAVDRPGIQALADNINQLLSQLSTEMPVQPTEVQIDCDWTSTTKDTYFLLLEALRRQAYFKDKLLSCTIRLHQLKNQRTSGIPPVDKGLLMCYNMGTLKRPGTHNSIIDVSLAKQYLEKPGAYPLPLDIALPIFSWSLQFREGRFVGILRDITPEQIRTTPFFTKQSASVFRCTQDTFLQDYELRKDDLIRIEESGKKDVVQLASYAAKLLRSDSARVLLFHADSLTLAKYSDDDLQEIFSDFH